MELREQAPAMTLARKLGDTEHRSGLAVQLARQSGAAECFAEWLLKIAVHRGATHYQRDFDPTLPPDNPAISDEEIGIALCLGQLPMPWTTSARRPSCSVPRAWTRSACAVSPCASVVSRCCSTSLRLRNASPPRWNPGPTSANTCHPVPCRAPMPCRTGPASSATPA